MASSCCTSNSHPPPMPSGLGSYHRTTIAFSSAVTLSAWHFDETTSDSVLRGTGAVARLLLPSERERRMIAPNGGVRHAVFVVRIARDRYRSPSCRRAGEVVLLRSGACLLPVCFHVLRAVAAVRASCLPAT